LTQSWNPPYPAIHRLWHLLVDDAGTCRRPLDASGIDRAGMTHAVAMLDSSLKHIGNGLDPPVRVPGKTGKVILRPVGPEVVEHQERVK
jgi:hypothetical protein